YLNPDVTVRFDSIQLSPEGPDRVLVSGVRGEPAPDSLKVSINYVGGYRNTMTFVITGLEVEAKAEIARRQLFESLGGEAAFDHVDVQLLRTDRPDAASNAEAMAQLRVTVKDRDANKVGRAFSNKFIELALSSYPGFFTTTPPEAETAELQVQRYPLPNIRSLNFVVIGLLGEGVASSTRIDPQAKGLGEYLCSRTVELPEALLEDVPGA